MSTTSDVLRMYLVRHGETACSVADVLCGRCDATLTEAGRQTAEQMATAFGATRMDALYSSPLSRARQTLAPLAVVQNLDVTLLPDFTEIDFGAWDGRPSRDLMRRDATFRQFVERPDAQCAPGGESGRMVLQRALRGIATVRARHLRGRVWVMTHKTVLRLLLCHFTGVALRHYRQRFDQPTGAVNVVDFLPEAALLRISGDISYQHGTCNPSC